MARKREKPGIPIGSVEADSDGIYLTRMFVLIVGFSPG